MITPCGVVPQTSEAVNLTLEYAAGIVAGFEAHRFKTKMNQEFYDLDDVSVKQLLYVCLRTVAHIWNRTLKSRIEINPVKSAGNLGPDFMITYYKVKDAALSVKNQMGVACGLSHKSGDIASGSVMKNNNEIQGEIQISGYTIEKIIENPFFVANEIGKKLVGEDWRVYELIRNNTLNVSMTANANKKEAGR